MFTSRTEEITVLREFSDVLVRNLFSKSLWSHEVHRCALNEIVATKGKKASSSLLLKERGPHTLVCVTIEPELQGKKGFDAALFIITAPLSYRNRQLYAKMCIKSPLMSVKTNLLEVFERPGEIGSSTYIYRLNLRLCGNVSDLHIWAADWGPT